MRTVTQDSDTQTTTSDVLQEKIQKQLKRLRFTADPWPLVAQLASGYTLEKMEAVLQEIQAAIKLIKDLGVDDSVDRRNDTPLGGLTDTWYALEDLSYLEELQTFNDAIQTALQRGSWAAFLVYLSNPTAYLVFENAFPQSRLISLSDIKSHEDLHNFPRNKEGIKLKNNTITTHLNHCEYPSKPIELPIFTKIFINSSLRKFQDVIAFVIQTPVKPQNTSSPSPTAADVFYDCLTYPIAEAKNHNTLGIMLSYDNLKESFLVTLLSYMPQLAAVRFHYFYQESVSYEIPTFSEINISLLEWALANKQWSLFAAVLEKISEADLINLEQNNAFGQPLLFQLLYEISSIRDGWYSKYYIPIQVIIEKYLEKLPATLRNPLYTTPAQPTPFFDFDAPPLCHNGLSLSSYLAIYNPKFLIKLLSPSRPILTALNAKTCATIIKETIKNSPSIFTEELAHTVILTLRLTAPKQIQAANIQSYLPSIALENKTLIGCLVRLAEFGLNDIALLYLNTIHPEDITSFSHSSYHLKERYERFILEKLVTLARHIDKNNITLESFPSATPLEFTTAVLAMWSRVLFPEAPPSFSLPNLFPSKKEPSLEEKIQEKIDLYCKKQAIPLDAPKHRKVVMATL